MGDMYNEVRELMSERHLGTKKMRVTRLESHSHLMQR